jgi:hypothetical protein
MMYKTLWVLEHLAFGALVLLVIFLPVIASQIYKNWATGGRLAFPPAEYRRIENLEFGIFVGGYLLMIIIGLYIVAPSPAHAVNVPVNAASIVRAKCLRTPPEERSLKCRRLVGSN